MRNPFVDYLNSLHNDHAANQNAIGEMLIGSPFFGETQVKRSLIAFLKSKVENGEFIILTGHAGDGKTTLLYQVLEAAGYHLTKLQPSEMLTGEHPILYIKDFSELTHEDQDEKLSACFSTPGAAALIANTGPLLDMFKRMYGQQYESPLLNAMDSPCGMTVDVPGTGKAFLLNIARVDNTDFIRPYLQNILAERHWRECRGCPCAARCPIVFNQSVLSNDFDQVSDVIEKMYIWLQEYDRRATIRQITAHLTFMITGGLSCSKVEHKCSERSQFQYLASNLFFGCEQMKRLKGASQIRGIQMVNEAGFDQKTTLMDYELFNRNDYYLYYSQDIAALFKTAFVDHHYCDTESRQMILKRAYLFFGMQGENRTRQENYIFSEWFKPYLEITRKGVKPKDQLKNGVCKAINTLFVGESLEDRIDHIDLTLRRNNEQTSNVQLLAGRIQVDDVKLKAAQFETVSGNKQYKLTLCVKDLEFSISLPLLNYFNEIWRGIIITDVDPMLSNGIDSLKAQLLSHCSSSVSSDEVRIVYLSGDRWKKRTLVIGEHSIDHE